MKNNEFQVSTRPADRDTRTADAALREVMPDLLRFFLRRMGSREDAADAVSDTLLVLMRRPSAWPSDPEGFRRWTFGCARKVLMSSHRGRKRSADLAERVRTEFDALPAPDLTSEMIDLRRALEQLSARDRELVQLVAWEQLAVADAGKVLGLNAGAARTRYSRARARLRELLT